MTKKYPTGEDMFEDLNQARRTKLAAQREVERVESSIKMETETYSSIFNAKNSEQRALLLENAYKHHPQLSKTLVEKRKALDEATLDYEDILGRCKAALVLHGEAKLVAGL